MLSVVIERVQPPPAHNGITSVRSSSSIEISQGRHKTKKKLDYIMYFSDMLYMWDATWAVVAP